MARFTGLIGLVVLLGVAYALSTDRRAIRWRTVFWGLGLQFCFAFIVLRSGWGQRAMAAAGGFINTLLSYAFAGSSIVFGELGKQTAKAPTVLAVGELGLDFYRDRHQRAWRTVASVVCAMASR